MRFLKRFKRSKKRKPPTVIYTVNSLTPPQQVHENKDVNNEMTINTQQTQLNSVITVVEGDVEVVKKPNVDVIKEECSDEEKHSQNEHLNNGDVDDVVVDGVDNKGYENDEKTEEKEDLTQQKNHHHIDIDSSSFNDSGIEQDTNSTSN